MRRHELLSIVTTKSLVRFFRNVLTWVSENRGMFAAIRRAASRAPSFEFRSEISGYRCLNHGDGGDGGGDDDSTQEEHSYNNDGGGDGGGDGRNIVAPASRSPLSPRRDERRPLSAQ
jgi:hypothetical protein